MEYAETAVLVAVMDNDIAEADRRLRDFLPGELAEFERQASMLLDCIRNVAGAEQPDACYCGPNGGPHRHV